MPTATAERSAFRAVVFDLDGTLVDSAPDIARALNAAIATRGLAPFGVDDVKGFIGGGAPLSLRRAIAARSAAIDEAGLDAMLAHFLHVYREVSEEGNGLYGGAEELLRGLAVTGHRLAICTNKSEPITHVALAALGIERHFGAIVGARDGLPKKPAADMVLAALAGLGIGPAEAVMVGDSASDVGAARAAGIPVVVVSFGYAHSPVAGLGADLVIDHLSDLPGALARLRPA